MKTTARPSNEECRAKAWYRSTLCAAWSRLGDLSKARLYLCQAVVGTPRTLATAAKIVEALGLAIDLAEVGPKS
jgi:hypothetical protein